MRIAITYSNGEVFQHFGHSEQFKIYDTIDGKILGAKVVNTNGTGHGALANFLKNQMVEVLICGGIGNGAISALSNAEIKVCAGVSGNTDEAIVAFLNNKLVSKQNSTCNHHSDSNHQCGNHSC